MAYAYSETSSNTPNFSSGYTAFRSQCPLLRVADIRTGADWHYFEWTKHTDKTKKREDGEKPLLRQESSCGGANHKEVIRISK